MSDFNPLDEVPLAAPSWIQLVIFILDGSTSMTWDLAEPDGSLEGFQPVRKKATGVDGALKALLNRMKVSLKAANFWFAFVTFNQIVTEARPPIELLSIAASDSYDPTAHGTGGTCIRAGVDEAAEIAKSFMQREQHSELPVSVVGVVMSDGEDSDPKQTLAAAQRFKELPNTQLAACLFATKGKPANGARLLEAVVSEPRLYETVYDAEQLRAFFQASVTAPALHKPPIGLLGSGDGR